MLTPTYSSIGPNKAQHMNDTQPRDSNLPEINQHQGRVYIHQACGTATNVTGKDLVGLCNPFELVIGTICANCGTPDSTSTFSWEDTGEKVSTYRRRGVMQMPLLAIFSWLILPAIGGALGGVIGSNIQGKFGPMTDVGIGLGVFLMMLFVGPTVVQVVATKRILNRDR